MNDLVWLCPSNSARTVFRNYRGYITKSSITSIDKDKFSKKPTHKYTNRQNLTKILSDPDIYDHRVLPSKIKQENRLFPLHGKLFTSSNSRMI